MFERALMASWYGRFFWSWVFWPLMLLVRYVTRNKRNAFLNNPPSASAKPVIVVGNITVGGTGKTPLVIALVKHLQQQGIKAGIISRGYGGKLDAYPHSVQASDNSLQVGDEPYMLQQVLAVPVVVDPVRVRALDLICTMDVDVVISDDGLQHYQLPRDIEVCVLDANRGLGNGYLLPVGPLREESNRLDTVDFVLNSTTVKGNELTEAADHYPLQPTAWVNVKTAQIIPLANFNIQQNPLAIAGIGNPQKFFDTLAGLNIQCECKGYADHYPYSPQDFSGVQRQILMTQKDAVKLQAFAHEDMWYLQIEAVLPEVFLNKFDQKLKQCMESRHG